MEIQRLIFEFPTFCFSNFNLCVLFVLPIPDEYTIKSINKLIYKFLWNSRDRIKRNTVISPINRGGINLVDIETKFKALKASWIPRLLKNTGNLCMLFNSILRNNGCTFFLSDENESNMCRAKEKYRGVFEIQKSGDKTSSGEIGLDIRTHASPKVGQDQVSGGVSVLCWHAAPVAYVLWKPCTIR